MEFGALRNAAYETAGVLSQSAKRVGRHAALLWVPLLLDALAVCAGWAMIGFQGEPGNSIRLILEMGLPSIGHLLNMPLPAGALPFAAEEGSATGWAVFACFFALTSFAQGGYLTLLHRAAADDSDAERPSAAEAFLRGGWQGLPRFALLAAAVLLAKPALSLLLATMFGAAGLLLALLIMLALRFVWIYLELVIAVEGLDMLSALVPARRTLLAAAGPPLMTAVLMYSFAAVLSAVLHAYWHPFTLAAAAVIYVCGMSIFQTAFMLLYLRCRKA